MKKREVVYVEHKNGYTVVTLFDGNRYSEQRFLYYSKQEIISKLRKEHNTIVTRDVIRTWYYH